MPLPQSDLTGPLHRAFADHLSTGQFHDFIIYCKDGSGFKVHRNVLAAYSDFFKAAIGSDFVGVNQTMNLHDDDPALIARMLAFLYTGEYCVDSLTATPSGLPLYQFHGVQDPFLVDDMNWASKCRLHCHLFALADKYAIHTLRTQAHSRFARDYYHFYDEDDQSVSSDSSAEETSQDNKELEKTSSVVRVVYESTPESVTELRRVVVRNVRRNAKHSVFNNSAMRAVLKDVPDFAYDLTLAHQSSTVNHNSKCGKCGRDWVEYPHPCACGIVGTCGATECRQKWVRESVCLECYTVGVLSYPEPLPNPNEDE